MKNVSALWMCGKQKEGEKIGNDKNVIYALLLASIYIKVCAPLAADKINERHGK